MHHGYKEAKEVKDQKPLTEMVDLEAIRRHGLRSFHRLENALDELTNGIVSGQHVATPMEKKPESGN